MKSEARLDKKGKFLETTKLDIEKYSSKVPQYYSENIPDLLKKIIETQNLKTLLDCGCGDGNLLYALKKIGYFENRKIFAVDLSENRVGLVGRIDPTIHVSVDSVEELNTVSDHTIELLISTQVIEHVDDKKDIEAMSRVLKKDGRIYLSTVFKKWYAWYFYRNKGRWVLDPTHLREYSREAQLLDLILASGFRVLENQKSLFWFPVIDFFVKQVGIKNRSLYENRILSLLRRIKVPILGYYNWELVLVKP